MERRSNAPVGVFLFSSVSLTLYLVIKHVNKPRSYSKIDASDKMKEDSMRPLSVKADDDCLSLFYGHTEQTDGILEPIRNGSGFPIVNTISDDIVKSLKQTHEEYKKLPLQLYKQCVENMIIACVDIVCQRESDNKFLLFYRRDAPASNIWWW